MRNSRKNRRISASRRHSVNAARNERRWLNTELDRVEGLQLKKFLNQNGIKYEASDASVIGRKITHFEIFVNNDERYMIDDFIDSIDEQNVNSSKSVKCSTRRKRPIKASSLGNFTNDDFKRLMEQICDNIVEDYTHDGDIDESIREALEYEIETECTYYADCFNILWGSDVTDWSDADYNITSITQLAAWIIESEFYNEGYYDDVYERITNDDEDGDYE